MCTVSAVVDNMRQWPPQHWNLPRVNEMREILDRLDRIDKALGLPECDKNKRSDLEGYWATLGYGVSHAAPQT